MPGSVPRVRPRECTAESTRVGFEVVVVVVVELLDSAERPGSFVLHHSTIRRLPSLIGMPSGVSLLLLEVLRYRSQRPNPQLPRPLARSCLSVFATVFDRNLRRCKRWRCSASRTVSLSGALPPFFFRPLRSSSFREMDVCGDDIDQAQQLVDCRETSSTH